MNLAEIELLAREATPGPWSRHRHSETSVIGPEGWVVAACGGHANNLRDPDDIHRELTANAAFITACSPSVILRLVEIAKAAKPVAYSNGFDAALPDKIAALRSALDAAKQEGASNG